MSPSPTDKGFRHTFSVVLSSGGKEGPLLPEHGFVGFNCYWDKRSGWGTGRSAGVLEGKTKTSSHTHACEGNVRSTVERNGTLPSYVVKKLCFFGDKHQTEAWYYITGQSSSFFFYLFVKGKVYVCCALLHLRVREWGTLLRHLVSYGSRWFSNTKPSSSEGT